MDPTRSGAASALLAALVAAALLAAPRAAAAAGPASAAAQRAGLAQVHGNAPDRMTAEEIEAIRAEHMVEAAADAKTWALTRAQAAAAGDPSLAGKIRVCVNPETPYAMCNASDPGTTFEGMEVELFQDMSRRVPWLADPTKWAFTCTPFSRLDHDRINGTCLVAMGGLFAVNPLDPKTNYIKSSQSTTEAGSQILLMARQDTTTRKLFSPFMAFTWQLWVALLVTTLFVGVVLWMFDTIVKAAFYAGKTEEEFLAAQEAAALDAADAEDGNMDDNGTRAAAVAAAVAGKGDAAAAGAGANGAARTGSQRRRKRDAIHRTMVKSWTTKEDALASLDKTVRQTMLNLARVTTLPPSTSLPSQILLWAWGLLTLIMVAQFTGSTAAGLTAAQLTGGINSLGDLRGRRVVVWDVFEPQLRATGIMPVPMPAEDAEDEARMVERLRSGDADAIVMDANWVQYMAGTQCDLTIAGAPWNERFIAYQLNLRIQQPLIDDIDGAVVDAKQDGTVMNLIARTITAPQGSCANNRAVNKSPSIGFRQVAGLWVMLAIGLLLAGLLLCGMVVTKKSQPALKSTVERIKSRAPSGKSFSLKKKPPPTFQDVLGGDA